MEVGKHSRVFQQAGHRRLANPRKLRAVYQNDRKYAGMLARPARADETLLRSIGRGV